MQIDIICLLNEKRTYICFMCCELCSLLYAWHGMAYNTFENVKLKCYMFIDAVK